MIVGEVKEGSARFNPAARDPTVLGVALARFGCCAPSEGEALSKQLIAHGHVEGPGGHVIRMVAFGTVSDPVHGARWKTVSMGHVVDYLRGYLREHWDTLRHAQIKDPTIGLLALLEKWETHRQGV